MAYQRKTKDVFVIWYTYAGQREEIDTADTHKECKFLLGEYRLSYQGTGANVSYSRRRERITPQS